MNATITTPEVASYFDEKKIKRFQRIMTNPFLFRSVLLYSLPSAVITGMKITRLDDEGCEVKVPYRFFNKNPFKTTYWAILGMAAEMVGGAQLMMYTRHSTPSVANFVVGCEAKFINRALGVTRFESNDAQLMKSMVTESIETGEAVTFDTQTIGYSEDGTIVVDFKFTWSVKARGTSN